VSENLSEKFPPEVLPAGKTANLRHLQDDLDVRPVSYFPKPFYRPSRGRWYVQHDGVQTNLGTEMGEAFRKYHALMAEPQAGTPAATTKASVTATAKADVRVVDILDALLEWSQKNLAPRSYDWYRERAQSFVTTIPPDLTVAALCVHHVQRWVDAKDTWNSGMKRGCVLTIQRVLNWAVEQRYVNSSPLVGMKKPPAGKCEVVIGSEDYK
jgi:hypothetical protein